MSPVEFLYVLGLVTAAALIAYMYYKYRTFTKLVFEEKKLVLEKTIPVLEKFEPIVPPNYKEYYDFLLGFLKELKRVNEVLAQLPESERLKVLRAFAEKLK
jgi:hypothetical protein